MLRTKPSKHFDEGRCKTIYDVYFGRMKASPIAKILKMKPRTVRSIIERCKQRKQRKQLGRKQKLDVRLLLSLAGFVDFTGRSFMNFSSIQRQSQLRLMLIWDYSQDSVQYDDMYTDQKFAATFQCKVSLVKKEHHCMCTMSKNSQVVDNNAMPVVVLTDEFSFTVLHGNNCHCV